jgi:sec-independent protein translocase protein TatB
LPLFLLGQYDDRMSFSETIFLFVLALVIFGPKKLPEIARQVGKYLNEFRRASNEFKSQIEQEISNLEVEKKPSYLAPSPAPEGTTSRDLYPAATEAVLGQPPEHEPVTATLAEPTSETAIASVNTMEPTNSEAMHSESMTAEDTTHSPETVSPADPVTTSNTAEPHA